MTPRTFALEQISVASPCTADWDAMTGDRQKRFCDHCQKHVHNLSAMTRSDAEALICSGAGHLCVQYQKDTAGQMITLDYQPTAPMRWWMRWRPLAAAAALVSGMLVMTGITRANNPPPVAGGIRPPTTAPTSQPAPPTMGVMGEPAAVVPIESRMTKGDLVLPASTQPATMGKVAPQNPVTKGEMVAPVIGAEKGMMAVPAPAE